MAGTYYQELLIHRITLEIKRKKIFGGQTGGY
jgi:hypothetical protein